MDVRGDFLRPPHCTTTRTLLIKVYINDDPELTLTYFTTMSNLANLDLYIYICSMPRYQVSVYWTIGPLVYNYVTHLCISTYVLCTEKPRKRITS